jgi:hypothetical protein
VPARSCCHALLRAKACMFRPWMHIYARQILPANTACRPAFPCSRMDGCRPGDGNILPPRVPGAKIPFGHVHLTYNPSYSAYFFQQEQYFFLTKKLANSVFQPTYNSSRTAPGSTAATGPTGSRPPVVRAVPCHVTATGQAGAVRIGRRPHLIRKRERPVSRLPIF